MKHRRARLLSALVATAIIGGGSNALAQETVRLQMSTGGITGTYYMIAAPLAKFLSEHSNLRITPNTSGGGYENIRRVDAGQAQFGMTQPDTMYEAWQGQKPFDRPLRDWRVVGVVTPPMANHVIVRKEDNIKSASDLKGKTFAIGAPGSGSTVSMLRFLEESGLKSEVDARMLPHQDYPDMLLDGKIDAFSRLGSVPAAVVEEIGAQKDVGLVDFGPELDKSKFLDKYPYYQKVQVKAGTYKGIDRDVTLFGNAGFIIAHKDVPEDVVYEFTKLAYSDDASKRVSMAFSGVNLDAKNPLEGNIGPVHPGAARFWKEKGINIPEPYLK
jgi:TRAP transporter TAXI family solute receptor